MLLIRALRTNRKNQETHSQPVPALQNDGADGPSENEEYRTELPARSALVGRSPGVIPRQELDVPAQSALVGGSPGVVPRQELDVPA